MKPLDNEISKRERPKACILCGACLEVCPLVRVTGREELSPKAKHVLAKALRDADETAGAALAGKDVAELAGLCLACGKCEQACSQGLCAPDVVATLRAAHPSLRQWLWRQWIEKGDALWPALAWLARRAPKAAPCAMPADPTSPPATPLSDPRYAAFKTMGAEPALAPFLTLAGATAPDPPDNVVTLFPGCTAARLAPGWTATAVRLLERLGWRVPKNPSWACCGCTLGHAGCVDAQREAQRANVEAWRSMGRPRVAVFCATCRCGLQAYPKADLGWAEGEALAFSEAVVPLAGLLTGAAIVPDVQMLAHAPEMVYYHRPCHGAGKGKGPAADETFLAHALGDRLAGDTGGACCGMGGVMQLGAPALSRQVAAALWSKLTPRPGAAVVTGCSGCVLQLKATAPQGVAVGHWLELFAPASDSGSTRAAIEERGADVSLGAHAAF